MKSRLTALTHVVGVGWLFQSFASIIFLIAFTSDEASSVSQVFFGVRGGQRRPNGVANARTRYDGPADESFGGIGNGMTSYGNVDFASPPKRQSGMRSMHSASRDSLVNQTADQSIHRERQASVAEEKPSNQCKALYDYKANAEDPNEIGFKKGEVMTILDDSGKWWSVQRETADDTGKRQGIAPSNYLKRLTPEESRAAVRRV